jgi:putative ABC transport system permease protein
VGDSVTVQGRRFRIIGLSRGTNSVLTQFAFIALADAHELLGVPQLASFFLVRGEPGVAPDTLVARLNGRVARTRAFTRDAFAAGNLHELQEGLLPILVTVAVIGGTVALIVLTLLLSGAILEQRETYAVLKALGAASGTLTRVVVAQSLVAVFGGVISGLLLYALGAPLVLRLVPVLALALQPRAVIAVSGAAVVMGLLGALVPLWRVGRIDPAELFRA